jgi:hypothetical protein
MFQNFKNTLIAYFKILVTNTTFAFIGNASIYRFVIFTIVFIFTTNNFSSYISVHKDFTQKSNYTNVSTNKNFKLEKNANQGDSSDELFHMMDIEEIIAYSYSNDVFEQNLLKVILTNSIKYHYKESKKLQFHLDILSPPPQV